MLNHLVTDLIENTRRRLQDSGVQTVEEIRRYPERLAAFSPATDAERAQTKQFLSQNLYHSESLRPQKDGWRKDRQRPLRLLDGAPGQLCRPATSARWKPRRRARVICDYIAGMTDNYILDLHRKLIERSVSG